MQCEGADSTGHIDEAGFDANGAFLMMGLPMAVGSRRQKLHFCRSKYGMFFSTFFRFRSIWCLSLWGISLHLDMGNSNWSFGYLNFKHK